MKNEKEIVYTMFLFVPFVFYVSCTGQESTTNQKSTESSQSLTSHSSNKNMGQQSMSQNKQLLV